jgi:asparaginyl-tRNA synthetase
MKDSKVIPPKSWDNPKKHFSTLLRSEWYNNLALIQDKIVTSTIRFYSQKGYQFMMFPLTTGTISSPMGLGSDSQPVKIELEGIETYLADSMQFFLEVGVRLNNKGVYYIAPSFRGEKADSRHLCQFYHSEAEIVGNLEDVMNLVEEYIIFLTESFYQDINLNNIINNTAGGTEHLSNLLALKGKQFPRITMKEAIDILAVNNECFTEIDGFKTINSQGEKLLIKKFNGFVWLTHFNHMIVPFYQSEDSDGTARCADLLFGMGETVGSGERHFDGNAVRKALKMHNISEKEYDWYIKLKNSSKIQTAGFGMGVERYIAWLLNQDDIRDMQLLPRFNGEKIYF